MYFTIAVMLLGYLDTSSLLQLKYSLIVGVKIYNCGKYEW